MTIFTKGKAVVRSPASIMQAAAILGCRPALIAAFIDVEAAGSGFFSGGRLKVLPEKHVIYRYIPAGLRSEAQRLGLAAQSWSKDNYKGLESSDNRYRFLETIEDNYGPEIAALGASWGAGQVMGFNHLMVGYPSAVAMVKAFADSEDAQIIAIANFLKADGLDDEARAENLRGLARGYNGAGQVDYYAAKLQGALALAKQKYLNMGAEPKEPHSATLRLGDHGEAVLKLQEALTDLGAKLALDSDFGPATKVAVQEFQKAKGLLADGIAGRHTLDALGL